MYAFIRLHRKTTATSSPFLSFFFDSTVALMELTAEYGRSIVTFEPFFRFFARSPSRTQTRYQSKSVATRPMTSSDTFSGSAFKSFST